jgi:hypothetical protein
MTSSRMLALALVAWSQLGCDRPPPAIAPAPLPATPAVEQPRSPEAERQALAESVRAAIDGTPVDLGTLPAILLQPSRPVFVNLRADGESLARWWSGPETVSGPMNWHVLEAAISNALASISLEQRQRLTTVEIDLTDDARPHDPIHPQEWAEFEGLNAHGVQVHLGLRGQVVSVGELWSARAPSTAIASNVPLDQSLEQIETKWRLSHDQWLTAQFVSFTAEQILVELEPLRATSMFRGNEIVAIESVDAAAIEQLGALAVGWMAANVDEQGRLPYSYAPSQQRMSDDYNELRLWEASVALGRFAARRDDPALFDLNAGHIEYLLAHNFRYDGKLGVVEQDGKSKLGAIALAIRAIEQHPQRDRWAKQATALRATVDHLWRSDGSFTMFYSGSGTKPDATYWNFYPGETLLMWAETYAARPDPALLQQYRRSFVFYRDWHRTPENRKPAFVPWHLRAHATMLDALGGSEPALEAELREFCFELADFLVTIQEWGDDAVPLDTWGRFYEPEQDWGSPHASSDGIYTWSLVDAFRLAKAAGDADRTERYRLAILRGLRSLMQVQFVNEIDMFYVPHAERSRVAGGLRTLVSDNRIRIDNVSYAVLAALAVLEVFEPADFDPAIRRAASTP